jgi:predicted nucleic acid-binding protein
LTYLIDTNVWSELRNRGRADRKVRTWAEAANPSELYLSVVTVFELERGVLLMERRDSQQGARLRRWLEPHVLGPFERQILPIPDRSAKLLSPRRR